MHGLERWQLNKLKPAWRRFSAKINNGGKINIGFSPLDLELLNARYLKCWLKQRGFTNIHIQEIQECNNYVLEHIAYVSINGNRQFDSDDLISYNSKIIIACYSKQKILFPYAKDDIAKKHPTEIYQTLTTKGFINITTLGTNKLTCETFHKNGEIKKITIDGNDSYKKNQKFDYDSEIVIMYHSFERIET